MSKFLRKSGQCSCPIRVLKSSIPGLAAALGTGLHLLGAVRCHLAGCRCVLFALASAGWFRAGCVSGHQGDNETLMFLKILIWKDWWMWKAGINVLEAKPASMAGFEFWLLGVLMFDPPQPHQVVQDSINLGSAQGCHISLCSIKRTNEVCSVMKLLEGFLQEQAVYPTSYLQPYSQLEWVPCFSQNKKGISESWQCLGLRKLSFWLLTWCLYLSSVSQVFKGEVKGLAAYRSDLGGNSGLRL